MAATATANTATPRRRPAAAWEWAAVSGSSGAWRVEEEVGKQQLTRRTGLPARDLRALDPALSSYTSGVMAQDRAVVVNLERVRAVITADEVLVPGPRDPAVAPLVRELRARLIAPADATPAPPQEEDDGDVMVSPRSPGSEERRRKDGRALGSDRVLPFEFRALEVCLEFACKSLEHEEGKGVLAWDTVTRPREQGGLGIRDLGVQNNCLLLKLIHRMFTATDSSWARRVRSHADLTSFSGDMEGTHWVNLRELLPAVYQSITTVHVGNGKATSFWDDWWAGSWQASHSKRPKASVFEDGLRQQFVPRLSRAAEGELAEVRDMLSGVTLSSESDTHCSDLFVQDGTLHSSALYKLIMSATDPGCEFAKFVWQNRAPPPVQFFG